MQILINIILYIIIPFIIGWSCSDKTSTKVRDLILALIILTPYLLFLNMNGL